MAGNSRKPALPRISPEPGLADVWIKGVGVAWPEGGDLSLIRCANLLGRNVWFVKKTWAEELGKAAEHARDAIKQFAK